MFIRDYSDKSVIILGNGNNSYLVTFEYPNYFRILISKNVFNLFLIKLFYLLNENKATNKLNKCTNYYEDKLNFIVILLRTQNIRM